MFKLKTTPAVVAMALGTVLPLTLQAQTLPAPGLPSLTTPAPCTALSCVGSFEQPFVEPVIYSRSLADDRNPNLQGTPSAEKCITDPKTGLKKCKPAAGTISALPDGRFLYFNALEGTENFELSILVDFGQKAINDQTRVLTIPKGNNGSQATWKRPFPVDAGANPTGYPNTELIPGTTNNKTNGASGALFCADVVMLADGRVMAVGGTDYYSEPGINGSPFGLTELEGIRNARIFNPVNNMWAQAASMTYGRWYPSLVTLQDSKVFVASGVTKLLKPIYPQAPYQSGRNVVQTETYDPAADKWTENGALAQRSLPLFPRMHLLPNGHVFYNAGGQAFNPFGQSYDQALWNIAATYNPATKKWSDLGYAGFPLKFSDAGLQDLSHALNITNPGIAASLMNTLTGAAAKSPTALMSLITGSGVSSGKLPLTVDQIVGSGMRGSTFSIMLPMQPDTNGQYSTARFLTAGGVLTGVAATSPGLYTATALSRIDTVQTQLDAGQDPAKSSIAGYTSEMTGSMKTPRWYGTGVLLPDDSVMAFSGADRDGVVGPGLERAIKSAERFNPNTKTWEKMAVASHPRTYHNTAILMPDGRVLVGGHAPISTLYLKNINLAQFGLGPNDGRDPSFEIYNPPYVFAANRPKIQTVSKVGNVASGPQTEQIVGIYKLGDALKLTLAGGDKVDSIALVRHTTLTHLVDGDQRSILIPATAITQNGASVSFALPTQKAVMPQGAYMIFVRIKGQDGGNRTVLIPSESKTIFVQHS